MDNFAIFTCYLVLIATFTTQVFGHSCEIIVCEGDEYCCGFNQCCEYNWYNTWYIWFSVVLVVIVLVSICSACCCRRRYYQRQHTVLVQSPPDVTVVHAFDGTRPTMVGPATPVYQTSGYGNTNYGYQTAYGATAPPQQVTHPHPPPTYAPVYPNK